MGAVIVLGEVAVVKDVGLGLVFRDRRREEEGKVEREDRSQQ